MPGGLLQDDTAVVTGGAAGIGRGIALALAQEGARVVVADLDADKGAAVEAEARQAGLTATFVRADLSSVAGARALWTEAVARLGRISILVHGASPRRIETDTVLSVTDDTWEAMVSVNLRAGFVLGQEAARHMKRERIKGRILYLTSLHADVPRNLPHYSAAKAGTTMVMKELARALGPDGIRVNAIAPGWIMTERQKKLWVTEASLAAHLARQCVKDVLQPEDMVGPCLFLASEASRAITAQTIIADGGTL